MEGKTPRRYLAWRPLRTTKPNFHVAEGFGTLQLDFLAMVQKQARRKTSARILY